MWIYEVWANFFFTYRNVFNNGFYRDTSHTIQASIIQWNRWKKECKMETQNEKIEPVNVFLLNFIFFHRLLKVKWVIMIKIRTNIQI